MKLQIASKGLFTTFINSPEHHFLLDAGEGAATQLGGQIYSIRKILLSHAHTDHIAGLITLLHIRQRQKDAGNVQVFFPENTRKMDDLRRFIRPMDSIEWIGIPPSAEIELSKNLFFRAFQTTHVLPHTILQDNGEPLPDPTLQRFASACSLGYVLVERRTRLKPEFAAMSDAERQVVIRKAREEGRPPELSEPYTKSLFAFTGDTGPLPDSTLKALGSPDTLIHDATYINPVDRAADRETMTHCTLEEAIRAAHVANAKRLIGIHVSPRGHYIDKWDGVVRSLPRGVTLVSPSGRVVSMEIDPSRGETMDPSQPLNLLIPDPPEVKQARREKDASAPGGESRLPPEPRGIDSRRDGGCGRR